MNIPSVLICVDSSQRNVWYSNSLRKGRFCMKYSAVEDEVDVEVMEKELWQCEKGCLQVKGFTPFRRPKSTQNIVTDVMDEA